MEPLPLAVTLDQVTDMLPKEFAFYHLGHARANTGATRSLGSDDQISLIGYRVSGDPSFWIVLAHERDLEFSIYSEFGNILASRWVGQLSDALGQDFVLSHPMQISKSVIQAVESKLIPLVRRQYIHAHQSKEVPLEFWVLPHREERIGHA